MGKQIYDVTVRNELTGDTTIVSVACMSHVDAQTEALVQLFKTLGWRKATALKPRVALSEESYSASVGVG